MRLLDDIGTQRIDGRDVGDWYVRRDIETALLDRILELGSEPQIIVGEAGHGKSTLLWSLHRELRQHQRFPLLVSATWLQRGDDGTYITSSEDIVSAIATQPGAILLLDTADLLLHSPSARYEVIDLVDELARAGVPVVLTTRPQEGQSLPPNLGHKITLGSYSRDKELPAAIASLIAEFSTAGSVVPADPVAAIQSARARGMLVDDVCTSPLLLRLLFSLATPQFPHLELDVTGLYNLFWSRRVITDHRSGPNVPADGQGNLASTAGFLAIAMLALGTPEPRVEVLVRRAAQVAKSGGHGIDEAALHGHVRTLSRRGVLIATEDRVRFLHQTFFEFAAAQGLAARGAEAELPRLIERITATPDDLFLGAVVEQALVILGADPLARPAVRGCCRALIETAHPHLISIAMTAWAHHPSILELSVDVVAPVTDDLLRRFLRTLPRVHSHSASVADRLHELWFQRPSLRTAIATTAAYLAGRAPDAAATLVRRTGMYTELAGTQQAYLRSNSEPRTLLQNLAPTAPDLVREAVLEIVDGLTEPAKQATNERTRQGKQTIARYLYMVADLWISLGDDEFLDALEGVVGAVQARSGDSDAEVIRNALAAVIAADLRRRGCVTVGWQRSWLDWVDELCSNLEMPGGDQDPITGARLIAVGIVLREFRAPDHDDVIDATLARLFSLSGGAAPRQLARGCLSEILTTDSPARTSLIELLSASLDGHLPAEHQNFAPGAGLWAAVTRQTLRDPSIPVDVVHRILSASLHTYADDDRFFTAGNHVVALAPVAIVWGEGAAATAARTLSVVDVRNKLDRQAANIFLDGARDRAHQQPDQLIPAALAIARHVGRTGTVKDLLRHEGNHATLRAHAPLLQRWTEELITSNDNGQQDGADLLRLLMEQNIATPTLAQLMSWFDRSTSPQGKANLLTTIGICARRSESIADAVALFSQFVTTATTPEPRIAPSPEMRSQPVIAEAARDALLESLAHQTGSFTELWPTIYVLTFAPRLNGTRKSDVAGLRHLGRFLRTEAETGHIDEAIEHLDATCEALAVLDSNLRVKASNKLEGAVTAILRRAQDRHYEQLARLVGTAPSQTSAQLIHGLLDSALFADRARELGHHLNITPRVIGIGTFPDILVPVGTTPHLPPASVPEHPEPREPPELTVNGHQAARAIENLADRRRDLERATDNAYHAIRRHAHSANDKHLAWQLFGKSQATFYRLKAGPNWRPPARELCADIDRHGEAIGQSFGLTALHRNFTAAEQAVDDARHSRR